MSPSRRSLVASAAAVVAAALSKAREASAQQSPFAPTDQVPPPQGKPFILETENTAVLTTTLKYVESPRDSASSKPAMRFETSMAGLQVVGREWADAVGVTMTSVKPEQHAPVPGVLVVGRPGVVVAGDMELDPQRVAEFSEAVTTAAGAAASSINVNIGDVGAGVIGLQVPHADIVGQVFGATLTAPIVVDKTTGVLGVATTGAGLRGRALQSGGIGAVLESPPGDGEVAAMVRGDLVVEKGDVRAEGANFAGDVNVDGKISIKGVPILPPPPLPIRGKGVFLARTSSADIAHTDISESSFVQVVFTGEPRPAGLSVSHIDMFQGGCSIHLTGRTRTELPFNWIAFV